MELGYRTPDLLQRQCHLPSQLELRLCYGPGQSQTGRQGRRIVDVPTLTGKFPAANCAGGWQYVVNQYSANRDLAIELAVFMGSAKTQVFKAPSHSSNSPAYMPANNDPSVVKAYPSFPILAAQAKYERARPKTPFWTNMSTIAEQELTNALIGKTKSPKQALKDASRDREDRGNSGRPRLIRYRMGTTQATRSACGAAEVRRSRGGPLSPLPTAVPHSAQRRETWLWP